MDTLELELKKHPNGQQFYDFIVSGRSLYEMFRKSHPSCLWADSYDDNRQAIEELCLKRPSDLENNRVGLFVCEECGDMYCGGRSVVVSEDDTSISWSNFQDYSMDIDDENTVGIAFDDIEHLKHVKFIFEKQDYEAILSDRWQERWK